MKVMQDTICTDGTTHLRYITAAATSSSVVDSLDSKRRQLAQRLAAVASSDTEEATLVLTGSASSEDNATEIVERGDNPSVSDSALMCFVIG